MVLVVVLVLIAGCAVGAATPCFVEATFDPAMRTLRGVEEISVESQYDTVYFLLLANLDRERNPFLSSRVMDERYERGFEQSSTVIEGVDVVQPSGTVRLPFRLLAIPPALQTYSLEETVLAIDLPPPRRRPSLSGSPLRPMFRGSSPQTRVSMRGS